MNINATKYVCILLEKFGILCQLPKPDLSYVTLTQEYFSSNNWKMRDLKYALGWLLKDQKYQDEVAKYNKYPRITDFMRAKKDIDDKVINYCAEFHTTPDKAYDEIGNSSIQYLSRQLCIAQFDEIPY